MWEVYFNETQTTGADADTRWSADVPDQDYPTCPKCARWDDVSPAFESTRYTHYCLRCDYLWHDATAMSQIVDLPTWTR